MVRAPRTGLVVAFVLVALSAGAVATWLSLRPLVTSLFQAVRKAEAPPTPRKLQVHPPLPEPAASVGRPLEEALSSLDYAGDLASYAAFDATLQARLLHGDFESLDAYGAALVKSKARFPGGGWRLQRFGDALEGCPTGADSPDSEWQAHLDRLKTWMARFPHSKVAPGVTGLAWTDFAWKARGTGFAPSVTREGWRLFEDRLKGGRAILESAPAEARSPLWYSAMQTVALGQGWAREAYDNLFAQALANEPRYQNFYFRKAYYLQPRWHGVEGESEAFAATAADALGGEAGDQVFALVMLNLSAYDSVKEWRKAHARDWPRMKRGLASLRKEFGTGLHLENLCLKAAGYAGDLDFARGSAEVVGDHMDPDVWNTRAGFLDFQDWAFCRGKYTPKK